MWKVLKHLANLLLHLLFPDLCCHCGKSGRYLCRVCARLVDFHIEPITLTADSPLSNVTPAFTHSPPISNLITALKYSFIKGVATYLGELLYLHTNYPDVDAVTFVPLSKEKQRMRGFNQAEEIAKAFGHLTQLPVLPLLIRTQSSHSSQASLHSKHERLLNAKHQLFRYNTKIRAPTRVLLIDDVYTTGATLEACAAVLKQHGVKEVHGLVVAHGS